MRSRQWEISCCRFGGPADFNIECGDKALKLFTDKYPTSYDICVNELNGDNFVMEAIRIIKDIVEAEDKLIAESIFLVKYPSARNKNCKITCYTVEEWQRVKI